MLVAISTVRAAFASVLGVRPASRLLLHQTCVWIVLGIELGMDGPRCPLFRVIFACHEFSRVIPSEPGTTNFVAMYIAIPGDGLPLQNRLLE